MFTRLYFGLPFQVASFEICEYGRRTLITTWYAKQKESKEDLVKWIL